MSTEWWKSKDSFEAALREHGSISAAVEVLGGIGKTTARKFRLRHGIELNPQPKRTRVEWGYGPAELIRPATIEETETMLSFSDLHFPYEDVRLVESALALARHLQPHNIVLNGDVNDFFPLSRFNTGLERIDELQAEIDVANEFRVALRQACPDSRFIETEGNHDNRIYSYVCNNARALKSLRALERRSLFLYDELGIQWFPGAGFRPRPWFLVKHGSIVRAESGASAKAEQALAGISGISGHTHRLSTYRRGGYVKRQWTEQGCLCRLDPDYVTGSPNWTQGCVVVQFSTRTDAFTVEEVQVQDSRFVYGGRVF